MTGNIETMSLYERIDSFLSVASILIALGSIAISILRNSQLQKRLNRLKQLSETTDPTSFDITKDKTKYELIIHKREHRTDENKRTRYIIDTNGSIIQRNTSPRELYYSKKSCINKVIQLGYKIHYHK